MNYMKDNMTEYFRHMTQTDTYDYHNIVEYRDGEYVFVHPISEANVTAMRENMDDEDIKAFDKFIDTAWG